MLDVAGDADPAVGVLDVIATVVMRGTQLISLGKAYLALQEKKCFLKVSIWALNQRKLVISSQSLCKK